MKKYSKFILIGIVLLSALIRLWKIDSIPPSLFGDELDVGYHAYSIFKTGRDYSGQFLPLNFHSLAEWRTPLFIYSAVPSVTLFGITPLGVRLPAIIFGVLGIIGIYFLVRNLFKNENFALLTALVLTFSPWHIQYSRAAFEVTMLLAFLIWGLYFFFKSLEKKRLSLPAIFLLITTPLIYNTAKLFTPFLLLTIFFIWKKEILNLKNKELIKGFTLALVVAIPVVAATLSGEGTQRFGYLSVLNDPDRELKISQERVIDIRYLVGDQIQVSKFFHNKWIYWISNISEHYLQSYSSEFLFNNGDPNQRHSPPGIGQLYKVEFLVLLLGIFAFLQSKIDKEQKLLWLLWLIIAPIPSALTMGGGNHATRLILMLPPLILFISYGIFFLLDKFKGSYKIITVGSYSLVYVICIILYLHTYFVHYSYTSNRWWHDGYKQAINSIKHVEDNFDRVYLTMVDEPVWIFFAGWYEYPPAKWQQNYPFEKKYVEGFGQISYLDKYYFSAFNGDGGIYGLSENLNRNDLYLASVSEVGFNLIEEPGRIPLGLDLVDTAKYITGEPAFYLFKKE